MFELFPSRTIAVSLGQYAIHWYGVMYVLAFWITYMLLPYLGRLRGLKLSRDAYTWLIVCGAFGVLIGGRLGYALFYEPIYFLHHPLHVIAIWHGGMSSHGGFIGVAVALWMFLRTSSLSLLLTKESLPAGQAGLGEVSVKSSVLFAVFDIITVPVAIGLALGRVGNIINQEFGVYPYYEIAGDIVIAGICYAILRIPLTLTLAPSGERGKTTASGTVIATFLILYGITRFFLEYVRPQEWPHIFGMTRGQFLTIPVFAIGMLLFLYARSQPRPATRR